MSRLCENKLYSARWQNELDYRVRNNDDDEGANQRKRDKKSEDYALKWKMKKIGIDKSVPIKVLKQASNNYTNWRPN